MKRIERKEYLEQLTSFKDKQLIKIITGIRRCGKSTLMDIFEDYLRDNAVTAEQIVRINFEDYDNDYLRNPKALHSYVKERLLSDKMTYILLDEIQTVSDFQKVVDSLYIKKNVDIYLTGSNAHMLSGDLATLLSGRYVEIEMLPLSFKEFVYSTGDTTELGRKYADYQRNSSFPYTPTFESNQKQIHEYLSGVYNTVILKNVVGRFKTPDTMMLESIVRFVFDNIGNQLSTKKISDMVLCQEKVQIK